MITIETRREAYKMRPNSDRKADILRTLSHNEMTAREIAYRLGFQDLNAVKPRLTELKAEGLVRTTKKTLDPVTGRRVAVWRRVYS